MPDIRPDKRIVTQITTVKMRPDNQDDVLALMKERAKFMASQPGFVSVSLHRSEDGTHVVNYLQWTDKERLAAAHHSPEFRKKWPKFGELVQDVEPGVVGESRCRFILRGCTHAAAFSHLSGGNSQLLSITQANGDGLPPGRWERTRFRDLRSGTRACRLHPIDFSCPSALSRRH